MTTRWWTRRVSGSLSPQSGTRRERTWRRHTLISNLLKSTVFTDHWKYGSIHYACTLHTKYDEVMLQKRDKVYIIPPYTWDSHSFYFLVLSCFHLVPYSLLYILFITPSNQQKTLLYISGLRAKFNSSKISFHKHLDALTFRTFVLDPEVTLISNSGWSKAMLWFSSSVMVVVHLYLQS